MWQCHIKDIEGGVVMRKKVIIISMLIISVFLIGLLCIIHKDTNKIILKNDVFIYELGEEISADVSNYLKDADSIKNIKDYKISSSELTIINNKFALKESGFVSVGEYNVNIIYKKENATFVIKVVDTTPPEFIKFEEKLQYEQGTDISNLESNFEATDLTTVKVIVEGEYDSNKIGEYELKIIAIDENNNVNSKNSLIKIIPKKETIITDNSSNKTSSSNNNSNSNNAGNSQSVSSRNIVASLPRFRKDISDQYIVKLNEYRRSKGLSELQVTTEVQVEADRRAKEIYTNYSHDGVAYGFGENIGEGSVGVDFFVAWKNSPSHNAAMLREQNVAVAASVYEIDNHWYAVMSFKMNY